MYFVKLQIKLEPGYIDNSCSRFKNRKENVASLLDAEVVATNSLFRLKTNNQKRGMTMINYVTQGGAGGGVGYGILLSHMGYVNWLR